MAGLGRTAASLVNVVLLIVPLMALTIGAGALAGERERGTLESLLTQPVSRSEVLLGKYVGSAAALLAALALGFGTSALVLGLRGGPADAGRYAGVFGCSALLAWAMLSVGFLISALARGSAVAMGIAVFTWLGLVFFSDLVLMGSTLAFKLQATELFGLAVLNPLQVFKLAAIGQLHTSLDLLGPAGLYGVRAYGAALPLLLIAALLAWVVVPLATACVVFSRRGLR
jgi:Cu-processing system permease protein